MSRTKVLVVSKGDVGSVQLVANKEPIVKADYFEYLSCWIKDSQDPKKEIKAHTNEKKPKCYVYPILLLKCEIWIVKVNMIEIIRNGLIIECSKYHGSNLFQIYWS